jgi:hypothetical protein
MPNLIGSAPDQVPTNGHLGTMAYQEAIQYQAAIQSQATRNKIINGAFQVDQRNAYAAVTPASTAYVCDRWNLSIAAASKITSQVFNNVSNSPSTANAHFLNLSVASAFSSAASNFFTLGQSIEGFNLNGLNWGTASARPVTISFNAYASVAGTYALSVSNSAVNRSYVATFTLAAATATPVTLIIPGDTTGTWNWDGTVGATLKFDLGSGSNFNGSAGSWAAGNFSRTVDCVSWVANASAVFRITDVQFEIGTIQTAFERRLYPQEVALCQRYYEVFSGVCTTGAFIPYSFKVTKRTTPTTGILSLTAGSGFALVVVDSNSAYQSVANSSNSQFTAYATAEL